MGAGKSAFHVVATLIVGPTESILWDAHYKVSDGRRLADRVTETRTRLKAIILSHADHDHYMGAMEVLRRFPGTPVYMTAAGLKDFRQRSQRDLVDERSRRNVDPAEVPDTLVAPQLLPSGPLSVDGQEVEVMLGLTGDVRRPVSCAVWIPSLQAVLAGDLVFDGVHPWLGDSTIASRAAWRASLDRLAALRPALVVPGHKRDLDAPDSPDQVDFMMRYLTDFDVLMRAAATPAELERAMLEKYPELLIPELMIAGARGSFQK